MTKTLTKKWKDGELPVGSYYIKLVGDVERVDFFGGLKWERTKDFGIEEVLAPVPSFDEFQRLQDENKKLKEQIDDANEVIKGFPQLKDFYTWGYGEGSKIIAEKYLEKWGVK